MATESPTSLLVGRAQAGDRDAFDQVMERYRQRLEHQISSRMGARIRARLEPEDVLQETYTVAFQSIKQLQWDGDERFYRWLGSIAEHVIRSSSQRKAWDQIQLATDVPGSDLAPSKQLRRGERFDRLEKALRGLSDDHHQVITLARLEGLTVKEVAERMSRSPNAVKKLLARALASLKAAFGDTESFHLPDRKLDVGEDE